MFFDNVVDTLNKSSHLIILHHKLIWMYNHPDLEAQISIVSNGGLGDCSYCINPNYFYQNIYHQLVEVKQRGIEVLCITGDIGMKTKEFEYKQEKALILMHLEYSMAKLVTMH